MTGRLLVGALVLTLSPHALLRAQTTPTGSVGWYNGDCHSTGVGSWSNWYQSNQSFTRVYDEFTVPAGGWTISGVFSNNQLSNTAPPVTQASWEIRGSISAGHGDTVFGSGISAATSVYSALLGASRVEVAGLSVQLPSGTYALSVTPVGPGYRQSYVCETDGQGAVGTPRGDGPAFYSSVAGSYPWIPNTAGKNADFSQGVLISGPATQDPSLSLTDQWRLNVDSLVQQMLSLHSLPLPGISVDDFKQKAAVLSDRIPTLSEPEIRTGLLALVASIEDPHTDVAWPYPNPFRMLPLSFYWFDDGIYVTAAGPQYLDLLGMKLTAINHTSVEDAAVALSALVPHENDQWLKQRIPLQEIPNADFLFGTGLISSIDSVPLRFQSVDKGEVAIEVPTLASYQMPRQTQAFQGTLPLSRQHLDRNYWATIIDEGATVYFQYNSCMEDSKQPSKDFFDDLHKLQAQDGVERIVLDLRNNGGGFTSILSPWIAEMQNSRFNEQGRLYVIVGRATFSAAMEATNHLHDRTNAIFVGEPTGAKPQFQLRRGDFQLPHFGIRVSYSNGIEGAKETGPTLIPDILAGLTFEQYMNGVDPALDAILAIPAPGR
jgi:hypothetical protein